MRAVTRSFVSGVGYVSVPGLRGQRLVNPKFLARVFEIVEQFGDAGVTINDVMHLTRRNRITVDKALALLRDANRVDRKREGVTYHYWVWKGEEDRG